MKATQQLMPPSVCTAPFLLCSMAIIQCLWLTAIWHAGAANSWWKLPWLLGYSIVSFFIVRSLSTRYTSIFGRFQEHLILHEQLLLVALSALVVGVGGPYAFYQLGWPDEGHVFAASIIVAEHGVREFFDKYLQIPWLGKQHPPLVPLIYGFALKSFGVHLVVARWVSLLLGLGSLLLTYAIGRILYDRKLGLVSALLLLPMPFFFRVGATALTDMPVTFFSICALFFFFRLLQAPKLNLAFLTGLCLGLGLLCRYTAVLLYIVLFFCCITENSFHKLKFHLTLIVVVSAGILFLWLGYAWHRDILVTQIKTLFPYVGYVTSAPTGRKWLFSILSFRLPSGLGPYLFPLLFLGGWRLLQRRNSEDRLILAWIGGIFLPLLLTLPSPRYFLPAFPALAIVLAQGLDRVVKNAEQVLLLALLYGGGTLYLFVDWYRAAGGLFAR